MAQCIANLRECKWLMRKGPRMARTRWGTVHNGLGQLMDIWHQKLLVLLTFGILEGWMMPGAQKGAYVSTYCTGWSRGGGV